MNDPRRNIDEHPYSLVFGPDHDQRPQLTIATSTFLVPPSPETSASVSPINPAFSNPSTPYRFPLLSDQRHPLPLPRLDTNTPTSIASTSPVSAPVLTSYQSIPRPPRSSSLPFCDLDPSNSTSQTVSLRNPPSQSRSLTRPNPNFPHYSETLLRTRSRTQRFISIDKLDRTIPIFFLHGLRRTPHSSFL